ncbi:MAG: archaeal proteasome endopeptidase complex subunit alpha [Candidatus Thermoplasmatota archaeon]|jgi:proteasome alpha subunit|nr:archaeal proteasome endopeptidase complex subunit alpha [Candidatus Thermoplasmatota archaeon]
MEPDGALYDQASTIFSPDGRLYQVEYAREAINKGSTTLGLKYKDGVVLIAYKNYPSHLVEIQKMEKIFQIDDYIGCAFAGLSADAQRLVEIAQEEAQINKITYDEDITIKALTDIICEYKHAFTQYDGIRPFGVALIIAGIDNTGKKLYSTDPSGVFLEYKAVCEGANSTNVMTYLKNTYEKDLNLDTAIDISFKAIQKINKKKLNADSFEIAVIDKKKKFYKLTNKEIKDILRKS